MGLILLPQRHYKRDHRKRATAAWQAERKIVDNESVFKHKP
jgi:hypothetical protein